MVMKDAIKDKTDQYNGVGKPQQHQASEDVSKWGLKKERKAKDSDSDFDDDFFGDDAKIMGDMKAARVAAAKYAQEEERTNKTLGHGTYIEIVESEFLPLVTKTDYVVVAFFHKDFERCKIIDMHMHKIAQNHVEARFVRMDAERAPFFIQKLQVQMLPTIILFCNGVAVDNICGFDELGGNDDFPTLALTRRLITGGVLMPRTKAEDPSQKISRPGAKRSANNRGGEDSDY